MRMFKDRLGHPIRERFSFSTHKEYDENTVTVRDNLTKDERTWGYWVDDKHISKWMREQRKKTRKTKEGKSAA